MNITPGKPQATAAEGRESFAKQQQARANAIKAFTGQQPSQVVANQTQVQPEEMGAIRAQENRQSSTEEAPAEIPVPNVDTKAPQVEDPNLSRQFAQLARQEKALRAKAQQQEQALKAKEAALAAREQEYATKDQEYAQKYIQRQFLKDNPLQALAEAEVSYDDLTQQILNQGNQQADPRLLATISKLEAKIKSLEEKTDAVSANSAKAEVAQREAAIKQIRQDVDKLIASDDNYETIRHTRANKDVVELITRTFDEDGVLMSVEEAANEIENYILEEAVKLSQLGKVQKKSRPAASATTTSAPVDTQPKKAQTQPTMKTLTNAGASTRPLTVRERAIMAFKGELK